jgi:hypothetical protein
MRKLTEIDCNNICNDYLLVNSKSDIELIENILYTSSNDYYLKRKKEKFK